METSNTQTFSVDVNHFEKQIDLIAGQILAKKPDAHEAGLLGGNAGITLMFAYLSQVFPQKGYLQNTLDYLDELGNSLANEVLNHSMSSGVAGIAFVFQHLRNIGILDKQDDLNLEELDEFIARGAENDFRISNWDPLHGITGLGIYFLERNLETGETKYLEKIVDCLAALQTEKESFHVWVTPGYGKYSNDNFNFGMAHGMPGILSFLAQVYARGIRKNEIEEMISGAMPYLLSQEYSDDVYCFPTAIDVIPTEESENHNSRLAWCYGDLCLAFSLLQCGNNLQREEWKTKGIEIALKTTRRTFENSGCTDAPFCHGSVGLMHLYQRLYLLTGHEDFRNAAQQWLEITQSQYYKPGEGVGGYYYRTFNEEENLFKLTPQDGLLEGSAGIALVYLYYFFDNKPDWDRIFLTNV